MSAERRLTWSEAALLAALTLICRVVFLLLLPDTAVSFDVPHAREVAERLQRGENPYATTAYLNWPPFWMQLLFVFQKLAVSTGWAFDRIVLGFLVVVDTINVVLAWFIARRFLQVGPPMKVLFLGLIVNPVSLFLICQHRHFDAILVTALLLFAVSLLRYRESGDVADWLAACFTLGIGVLIKTVPIFLVPLLAFGIAGAGRRARVLGGLLVITPALIGMSVIYVLSPDQVTRNVLGYRSYPGWFGVTGLLELARLNGVASVYGRVFPLAVIAGLVIAARTFVRRIAVQPEQILLAIGTVLAALVALAPGYATQYIAWPLPFFVLTYFCFDRPWKTDLVVAWFVSLLTYTVDYGLLTELGAFLVAFNPSPRMIHLSDVFSEPGVKTLVRLPLFATYLWILAGAVRRLRPVPRSQSRAGFKRD